MKIAITSLVRCIFTFVVLFFLSPPAYSQSSINEGLVTNTVYASPTGSDANNGLSAGAPKTLPGAITFCQNKLSKIILLDGDYRMSLSIPSGNTLLILQAQNTGKAVISGSDLVTNWASYAGGYYTLPWTNNWGLGNNGFGSWPTTNSRLEMVFIDGARLSGLCDASGNPVATNTLAAGQFTVDETANIITFKPPTGVTLSATNKVEVAVRNVNGVATSLSPLVTVSQRSNFVLRGLIFQHAAGYVKNGQALALSGQNGTTPATQLLVEDCTFQNNNGIGMEVSGYDYVTLNRVNGSNNGARGGGFYWTRHALVEDCSWNGNNWRCFPNNVGNDAAGFKTYDGFTTDSWFMRSSGDINFLRCSFKNNLSVGYWEDTAGTNTTLASCLFENNEQGGIDSEITPGPLTITNCVVRSNGWFGLLIYGSPNGRVLNSYLYGTRPSAAIQPDPQHCGEIMPTLDDRTNTLMSGTGNWTRIDHWSISNCVIQATVGVNYNGQTPGGVPIFDAVSYASVNPNRPAKLALINTLSANSNKWWRAYGYSSYTASQAFYSNTNFALSWQNEFTDLTFAQWTNQSNTLGKQDLNSTFGSVNLSNVPDPTTNGVSAATTSTALTSSLNPSIYGSSVTFTATVSTNGVTAVGVTGSVIFYDGATALGTNSLAAGVTTYTNSTFSAGSHSITAVYGGDANYNGSASTLLTQVVNKAIPTITTVPTASAITYGQTLATSSLGGGSASVAGSFAFTSPSTAPNAGTAAQSVTFTPTDSANYNSAATNVNVTVNQAATTTGLASSLNPSTNGNSVVFTATVSPGVATGSVIFYEGATALGTNSLTAGLAKYTNTTFTAGNHSVTATYGGDANYTGSTSAILTQVVNAAVNYVSVTNVLLSDGFTDNTRSGQNLPGSADWWFRTANSTNPTVDASGGAMAVYPTNNLSVAGGPGYTFLSYFTSVGSTVNLVNAGDSITVSFKLTPQALNTLAQNNNISGRMRCRIGLFNTSTASRLTGDTNGVTTATVFNNSTPGYYFDANHDGTDVAGNNTPVAGHLEFNGQARNINYDGTSLALFGTYKGTGNANMADVCTASDINNFLTAGATNTIKLTLTRTADNGGSIQMSVTYVSPTATNTFNLGTNTLTGSFTSSFDTFSMATFAANAGSAPYAHVFGSNQIYDDITVSTVRSLVATTTLLASSTNPSTYGGNITLTATVTPSAATGSVIFYDGGTPLSTNPVSAGVATYSTSALSTGSHSLSATYYGDNTFAGSTSTALTQTVNKVTPAMSLLSNTNPAGYLSAFVFTTTLPVDATGSVIFSTTSGPFSTNGLAGGSATSLSISGLPRGTNLITASYSGDGKYLAVTNTLNQVVTNHSPAVSSIVIGALAGVPTVTKIIGGKNSPTDADGDSLSVSAVQNPSNQGGLVTTDGTNIFYTAVNTYAGTDTFNYTVNDGFGGSGVAIISASVITNGSGQNRVSAQMIGGQAVLSFLGVPNSAYALEFTHNLSSAPSWTPLATNTTSANGLLAFTNIPSGSNDFYRARFVP